MSTNDESHIQSRQERRASAPRGREGLPSGRIVFFRINQGCPGDGSEKRALVYCSPVSPRFFVMS